MFVFFLLLLVLFFLIFFLFIISQLVTMMISECKEINGKEIIARYENYKERLNKSKKLHIIFLKIHV